MKYAGTKALFSHWNGLRRARTAPARAEIDPVAMPHLLPDVMILERTDQEGLQFRLAGTRLCTVFGRELKGVVLGSLFDPESAIELQLYAGTVTGEAAAVVLGLACTTDHGRRETAEMLLLPLSGTFPAQLLGIFSFPALPAWYPVHGIARLEITTARVVWPSGRPAMDVEAVAAPLREPPRVASGMQPDGRRVGRFLVIDGARADR